jgi:hypothetical protein
MSMAFTRALGCYIRDDYKQKFRGLFVPKVRSVALLKENRKKDKNDFEKLLLLIVPFMSLPLYMEN